MPTDINARPVNMATSVQHSVGLHLPTTCVGHGITLRPIAHDLSACDQTTDDLDRIAAAILITVSLDMEDILPPDIMSKHRYTLLADDDITYN